MLQRTRRVLAALGAALVFVASAATVSVAGSEPGGNATFRLILRGDVVAGDAFSLAVNADNGLIISPGIRCGPGSELYTPAFRACAPGTYEFVVEARSSLPVGTELSYVWARIHGEGIDTVIYTDAVTITKSAQTVSVVYDYGGVTLPDTAMPTQRGPLALGVALVGVSLLLAAGLTRRPIGRNLTLA